MDANEFLEKVKKRARLQGRRRAKFVTVAVLDSLRNMVSQKTSDRVDPQVPEDFWPRQPVEAMSQLLPTFESFDVHGFLRRVQMGLGSRDVGEAERGSYAVLSVLREALDERTNQMIADDLPSDMRVMWTRATEAVPPARAEQPAAGGAVAGAGEERVQPTDTGTATPRIETRADLPTSQVEGEAMPTGTSREMAEDEARPKAVPPEAQDVTAASQPRPRSPEMGAHGQWPPDVLASERYRAEQQLADEIERLLEANDQVDASDIDVQVVRGEVILRGSVRSRRERDVAQRVVSDALQSTSVKNEIRVAV